VPPSPVLSERAIKSLVTGDDKRVHVSEKGGVLTFAPSHPLSVSSLQSRDFYSRAFSCLVSRQSFVLRMSLISVTFKILGKGQIHKSRCKNLLVYK
jgi:hypothetical protein